MTELGLPAYFDTIASGALILGFLLVLYSIVYRNYRNHKKLPSLNFLAPLVAFYIWWVPLFPQKEFYLMLVPFFHSLQYLPFAWRMESAHLQTKNKPQWSFTLRLVTLLLVGFLAFEAIPSLLESNISSGLEQPVFFMLAAVVFINVHHFFLDSVLWRFQDAEVRAVLLSANDSRRIR